MGFTHLEQESRDCSRGDRGRQARKKRAQDCRERGERCRAGPNVSLSGKALRSGVATGCPKISNNGLRVSS